MRISVVFLLGTALGAFVMIMYSGVLLPKSDSTTAYQQQIYEAEVVDEATQEDSLQFGLEGNSLQVQPIISLQREPKSTSETKSTVSQLRLNTPTAKQAMTGSSPEWWSRDWPRSAVSGLVHQFVGTKPLFPRCSYNAGTQAHTYPVLEPHDYLANSKNPCWYEMPRIKKGLRCIPYVFLAGVAKCGTTDLARRLRMHPDFFTGTSKEYHWWERFRFGQEAISYREYQAQITGKKELLDLQTELEQKGSSVRIFGDFSPSYLWDPRHWPVLKGNEGCLEPRVIHAQHIRHVFPDAKIILTFRHPTPRLYSRFLSRIHRTPALKSATSAVFHSYVVQGVRQYKACFRKWSVRHCAYNETLYKDVTVRLVEGMYPVFMADWLRVWPREQMFIMRYEDYGGHERERITELLHFLDLAPLNRTEMDKMMVQDVVNSGSEEYETYGPLLPETKQVLDEFYQPFITQFAQLLNDTRFLWKDVKR